VLETYGINPNKLAVATGIGGSSINFWMNKNRTPSGDATLEIRRGLQKIYPVAAAEFIWLYLDESERMGSSCRG
jgi:hypothetical protein